MQSGGMYEMLQKFSVVSLLNRILLCEVAGSSPVKQTK